MRHLNRFFVIAVSLQCLFSSCKRAEEYAITTGGPEVIEFRALPFALSDVKLLDGPFRRATELNVNSLLNYEPDRFLAKFREQAGLPPKAEQYYGWEAMSLAGHSLGHYLSACALMYQTTGDEEFFRRVNYIVDELAYCQEVDGDGYFGAFVRENFADRDSDITEDEGRGYKKGKQVFEEEIARGIIVSSPFSLNGIWAPFYTQHKLLAGLRDAYLLCGNRKALEIKKAFSDWLYTIVSDLPDDTIREMLVCEYGGINEVFAELYGLTGDQRYLELSMIFHDTAVLGPLARGQDNLHGLHANTQIPKITGLARRYELTGNKKERETAQFFWQTVVNNYSYVTGGNCNEEYFGEPGKLRDRLGPNTTETCNVYNMLRLTKHLFQWEADAKAADFYERALLNHIHSSQHPEDGRVIYNLNIDMGGRKQFQNPYGFTCCVGTGMETHSKYGGSIYFYNDQELFVSQFIASELYWREKGLKLRQITAYPDEEGTRFEIETDVPVTFTLQIRYPHWAQKGIEIIFNGKKERINAMPGSFIPLMREWRTGDKIEVIMPFSLRLENMPDDKNRVALFHGPVLLAGDLGPPDERGYTDPHYVPAIMSADRDPGMWTEPLPGLHNFKTTAGKPRNVELKPFYAVYDRRYTVFWDMMNEEGWMRREEIIQQKKENYSLLEELATDRVIPGDSDNEQKHNFRGEKTSIRYYLERYCREADRGGWFSYDLMIPYNEPAYLVTDYWGGFEGSRTFDILADGKVIAAVNISGSKPGNFFKTAYALPDSLTMDKHTVTITFRPHEFNRAGPVFGIYAIEEKALQSVDLISISR